MVPRDKHHKMYTKTVDGVIRLITRVSHGSGGKDIGVQNLKKMANQCSLSLDEFYQLVDCSLSADAWDALVRERCAGGTNPLIGH